MELNELLRQLKDAGEIFTRENSNLNSPESNATQLTSIVMDYVVGIDEIDGFSSNNLGFTKSFRITSKMGRRNRETGSRTGEISFRATATFRFKKWADGSWDTQVELSF